MHVAFVVTMAVQVAFSGTETDLYKSLSASILLYTLPMGVFLVSIQFKICSTNVFSTFLLSIHPSIFGGGACWSLSQLQSAGCILILMELWGGKTLQRLTKKKHFGGRKQSI